VFSIQWAPVGCDGAGSEFLLQVADHVPAA
jgi:hypothetical protein